MTAGQPQAALIVARILVQQAAARAATVPDLKALARDAVAAEVWTPTVRAAFTRRRIAIEASS